MVLAHTSATGHALTVVAITGGFVVHWAAWCRRPTATIGPLARSAAAALGLVAVTSPPVEAIAERSFTGHMAQHLVLWVIVAPLLVSARPMVALTRAGGGFVERGPAGATALARAARRHAPAGFALVWAAVTITMYGTHLGPVYDAALGSSWLHGLEHAAYLASALLLWAALLHGPRALAAPRIALAAATAVPMIVLGVVLTTTDTAMYATYRDRLGAAALADQRAGGSLMWLGLMAAFLPALVHTAWRWAERDHHRAIVAEQLARRTTPLHPTPVKDLT